MGSRYATRYQFFLARLRDARQQAGLTQVQAAQALHLTQNFISKSERGERRVDVVELWDFAQIYARPLSFFLDMGDREPTATAQPRRRRSRR